MDSSGKKLCVGKYYQLETGQLAQYTGLDDSGRYYLFEWKNGVGVKHVLQKRSDMIINNPPIPDDNDGDGYGTDTEYKNNPHGDNPYGGRKNEKNKKNKKNEKNEKKQKPNPKQK